MRDDTEGTRPRRLSFTQHLQRMLHIEGSGTQKQSVGSHVPSGGNDSSVILHSDQSSGSKGKGKTSRPGVNDKSNDHTKTHNAYSYTTLGSRVSASDVENSENSPRHRSIQTTSQQLQAKPTPKDQPKRSDVCVSPTWNSNPTQKNERHATLRVEAKRAGHEKKFMKVEQSELTKNSIFIKREPRRLTKKQPFGSTSRASSVSLDTPDASRRFSSIFPGSRRTSRSRSQPSSVNGDDNDKSQLPPQSLRAGEVSNPVSTSQPTTPVLSTTLPESFCATISKELAVQSNPLLPIDIASSQPQKILQSVEMATAVEATEKQNHFSSSKKSRLHGQGFRQRSPVILGDSARTSAPDEPAELDRITFAASLDLGKRVFNSRQHSQRASLQQEFARDASRVPETNTTSKTPTASGNSAKIKTSNLPSSPSAQQLDSPEDTQIRYPLSDVNRRHRMGKSFTSSPLASLRTLKNSAGTQSDITSAERTSDLADNLNHGGPFVLCQTASHLNMIPSHSIASSRPQDSCYQNSRQLPIKTLDISMDTHQQSGLANDSKLPECRCKSHLGVATSGTQPKRLSTLTQRSNQKEQRVAGRARPRYREMPFVSPKGDSRSIQHRQTNLYTGPAPQKMIDRKGSDTSGPSMTHELGDSNVDLSRGEKPSVISLSTSLSNEPESDEYNTADEAASSGSGPQNDESRHIKPVIDDCTLAGSMTCCTENPLSSNPASRSAAHLLPPQLETSTENAKHLQHDKVVAKVFVICCHCRFWHDMPSEVYARLAYPNRPLESVGKSHYVNHAELKPNEQELTKGTTGIALPSSKLLSNGFHDLSKAPESKTRPPSAVVRCCWCQHHVSRVCCEGWTTIVHMRERHH